LNIFSIENNNILEIKNLEKHINLTFLCISNNPISEIKGLATLVNLQVLKIGGTKISRELIEELGGLDSPDFAKDIKKFVVYCKKKNINFMIFDLFVFEVQEPNLNLKLLKIILT